MRALATVWLVSAAACAKAPERAPYPLPEVDASGELVGRAGRVGLTTAEVQKRIDAQGPFLRGRYQDVGKRTELVEAELKFELLAQEAWDRGLERHPDVVKDTKKRMVQELLRARLDATIAKTPVSEAELAAEYAAKRDELNKPEMVRFDHLTRATTPATVDAERRALEALAATIGRLSGGRAAEALEAELRRGSGTTRGEDPQAFWTLADLEARLGPTLAGEVFRTEVERFVVGATDGAVHLFRITGRRRAVERSLEQAKPQLRAAILERRRTEALEAFLTELKAKHGYSLEPRAIESMTLTPSPGAP